MKALAAATITASAIIVFVAFKDRSRR